VLICLALGVLFFPQIAGYAARTYLLAHGAQLAGCSLSKESASVYRVADCKLVLPLNNKELRVLLENTGISFDSLSALMQQGPAVTVDTLDVQAAEVKQATPPFGSGAAADGAASLPFFSTLKVKDGHVSWAKQADLRFALQVERQSESSAHFSLHALALTLLPYMQKNAFAVQGTVTADNSGKSVEFESADATLSQEQLITPIPGLQFEGGNLSGKGRLHYRSEQPLEVQFSLQGRDLRGRWKDAAFSGLQIQGSLASEPRWHTLSPAMIAVSSLESSLPLHDIRMQVSLLGDRSGPLRVRVSNLTAAAFDGLLRVPELEVISGRPVTFRLEAQHIDVSQLLSYSQYNMQASGRVNVSIPLEVVDGTIRIQDGRITTSSGGDIRYSPSDAMKSRAKENPQLALALDALEQFNYRSLDAHFDYGDKGILTAQVALVGSSPKVQDGRQIEFNVNVQDNVPALIESLRFFTDSRSSIKSAQ
jgi:hypothetical protein